MPQTQRAAINIENNKTEQKNKIKETSIYSLPSCFLSLGIKISTKKKEKKKKKRKKKKEKKEKKKNEKERKKKLGNHSYNKPKEKQNRLLLSRKNVNISRRPEIPSRKK